MKNLDFPNVTGPVIGISEAFGVIKLGDILQCAFASKWVFYGAFNACLIEINGRLRT